MRQRRHENVFKRYCPSNRFPKLIGFNTIHHAPFRPSGLPATPVARLLSIRTSLERGTRNLLLSVAAILFVHTHIYINIMNQLVLFDRHKLRCRWAAQFRNYSYLSELLP